MTLNVQLDSECYVTRGIVPRAAQPASFEALWALHPAERATVVVHGRRVQSPRWSSAYERSYVYSRQVAEARPLPDMLRPLLRWAQREVDGRLNGVLVNWHDGALGHYHAKHRDSTAGLVAGTCIVTVSLGEERVFRLRPYATKRAAAGGGAGATAGAGERIDITLRDGDYVVMPWETNARWTHEVPRFKRYGGRRISVTMRAFE